jgi:hypothetical protein
MKGIPNSQVEFYLELCTSLVRCDPLSLESKKNLARDVSTMEKRTRSEGLSFLTKTLPKLGKALDQGLLSSRLLIPREFGNSHKDCGIPAFLQAYFRRVFDTQGVLLAEPSAEAVRHLRQVLFFAYKLELPYSEEQEASVVDAFIEAEKELELGADVYSAELQKVMRKLTRDIFVSFNPKDIVPRHGPGAVATGEKLEEKWVFKRLYNAIHQVFPYYEYFVVGSSRELVDRRSWYKSLERLETGVAKVVLVPKDSRGPRLISCEPLEFQWIQQGLGRKLMEFFEHHSMTKGHINFTRQEINRSLALEGSILQNWATIDLKEASDRVSLELVRSVFQDCPDLLRALEACRTTATKLPSGEVLALKKFAPMGSALCFPVEAYVFWAILVAAMSLKLKLPLKTVGERIFVYGDDIIVPTDWAAQCTIALERLALKVNHSKCCVTGSFRESCGMDAFKGVDVTPTRMKKLWSASRNDGVALASYTSVANQMVAKGYAVTASILWERIQSVYGFIPYGTKQSSFPCYEVNDPAVAEEMNLQCGVRVRFSDRYQRFEFRVKRIVSGKLDTVLDGWARLLKNVNSGAGDEPDVVVVPRSTKIRAGWSPV